MMKSALRHALRSSEGRAEALIAFADCQLGLHAFVLIEFHRPEAQENGRLAMRYARPWEDLRGVPPNREEDTDLIMRACFARIRADHSEDAKFLGR